MLRLSKGGSLQPVQIALLAQKLIGVLHHIGEFYYCSQCSNAVLGRPICFHRSEHSRDRARL